MPNLAICQIGISIAYFYMIFNKKLSLARILAPSFSNPSIYYYKNPSFFLGFFLVRPEGFVEPRRKNSPLDYFCLRFGKLSLARILAPSFSNPSIYYYKNPSFFLGFFFGAPGGIRTPDLQVRSLPFYPAKLRAHLFYKYIILILCLFFNRF